jgi:hypothetical protein
MSEYMGPLTIFLLSLVGAGLGAYFGAYLREKGKNLATHEDIKRLTRIAEEIKSQVSAELWLGQTRWNLRRDLYARLLEGLSDVQSSIHRLIGSMKMKAEAADPAVKSYHVGEITKGLAEYFEATHKVRRAHSVAAIFLSEEAMEALRKMGADMVRASQEGTSGEKYRDLLAGATESASKVLIEAARRDLLDL